MQMGQQGPGTGADRLSQRSGHDLKNIFSTIKANTEMLLEEVAGDVVLRRLERILAACSLGIERIDQIRGLDQDAQMPGAGESFFPSEQRRVLVVDDEEDIMRILVRYLTRAGFSVKGYTSARVALTDFLDAPLQVDLVITDLLMPDMSGPDLARELLKQRPNLPILAVTGYDRDMTSQQKADLGFCAFIAKPLDRGRVIAAVRAALATAPPSRET
jgi:CheY-like chemotaxis protein